MLLRQNTLVELNCITGESVRKGFGEDDHFGKFAQDRMGYKKSYVW
jgi:hypothetical protein